MFGMGIWLYHYAIITSFEKKNLVKKLLVNLGSYITIFIPDSYQTVSLTVTYEYSS